jgi:hypothetical protein
MKFLIEREFKETYIIDAESLDQAHRIVDACDCEAIAVTWGEVTEAREIDSNELVNMGYYLPRAGQAN